jgi:AcrR family transcriptional regulator
MKIPDHIVGSPSALARRPPPRERLLIAAEAVWSETGYAAARVEDILRAADVSRATFYLNFATKEELAAALLERAVQVLLATATQRSLGGASFEAKVALALEAYLELWDQHGRIVQELTAEALRPGSSLGPVRERAVEAAVAVLCAQFQVVRGEPVAPMVVRHMILGIEAVLLHQQLGKRGSRELHAMLVEVVLGAVGRPASSAAVTTRPRDSSRRGTRTARRTRARS